MFEYYGHSEFSVRSELGFATPEVCVCVLSSLLPSYTENIGTGGKTFYLFIFINSFNENSVLFFISYYFIEKHDLYNYYGMVIFFFFFYYYFIIV